MNNQEGIMPGIRPAGSGNVSVSTDVAVENEVETPKEPAQQPQESSNPNAAPNNANSMRGDLGFFGQMQGLILRDALPAGNAAPLFNTNIAQGAPDPNATNALRLKMLPDELEKANVPKDVRDALVSQLSAKSGDDLRKTLDQADAALKSKDAKGDVKALVTQGKVDAYFQSFNAEYQLPNGSKVHATPHFRMTNGASGPENRTQFPQVRADLQKLIQNHDKGLPKDQQLWGPKMQEAIRYVAGGKGTSEQVKMITDALIKSGEFEKAKAAHPGLSDSDTIRMMQWDHGVGIDCAGYVSQAFVGVHGGNNKKYGLQQTNDENLMYLKGNSNFVKVKPENIKPGDLIALDPPSKGDVGHTLLVRNHHIATKEERNHFVHNGDAFEKRSDKIHIYEVDASWGAGQKGNLEGGLQRRVFIYNETTGKWGEADKPDKDGDFEVRPSTTNGPYDHPMNGIYHPKGE
jgi:cell wall-associated NlpC family hydrolase